MKTPDQWYRELPPFTRYYFTAIIATTLLVTFNIVSTQLLYLDFEFITTEWQIWRLFTCFFFMGKLSFNFIFAISMLINYMGSLEKEYYSGTAGRANMLVMLTFAVVSIYLVHVFMMPLYFPTAVITLFIGYVWSRKQPMRPIAFYGFAFKAWHLPFLLLVLDLLFGNSLIPGIVGIFIGHTYHFLMDVVPKRYGWFLLRTPEFVYKMMEKQEMEQQAPYVPAFRNSAGHRLE